MTYKEVAGKRTLSQVDDQVHEQLHAKWLLWHSAIYKIIFFLILGHAVLLENEKADLLVGLVASAT